MRQTIFVQDWRTRVVYSPEGPQPQVLMDNGKMKTLVAGLEAGQKIPQHPEAAAIYHFLEGDGWMVVDNERFAVSAGSTIIMSDRVSRGVEAATRLAFLATRVA